MKIAPKHVVSLTYDLYTKKENGTEEFVESADTNHPLIFLYGAGQMLPKFEENLNALSAGYTYDFHLAAKDAYGVYDEEAVANLPLEMFKDVDMPGIGNVIPLQDNQGN